jgi:hypothetical protein
VQVRNGLRYEQAFRDLLTKFEVAWTLYRAACEHLLRQLPISNQDFDDLLENPQSGKWQEDHLDKKLRSLLSTSYVPYKNSTESLHRKMEKLRKKLKLNEDYLVCQPLLRLGQYLTTSKPPWVTIIDGEPTPNDKEREQFFKSKRTRWIGAFNVDGCRRHIELMLSDVQVIRDMVKDTIELEPSRRKRQNQRDSAHWIAIRDKAEQVFKALESRWARACACPHVHCASLQLLTADYASLANVEESEMRVVLTFECTPQCSALPPWLWRDIKVISQKVARYVISMPSKSLSIYLISNTVALQIVSSMHLLYDSCL